MSKIHVLPDENLGGVLREFREVDRPAREGDLIVVYDGNDIYEDITVGKPYPIHKTFKSIGGDDYIKFYDDVGDERVWDTPSEDYAVIEPTDIVRIYESDDICGVYMRYRLVDRKAKVGEKVIVVDAHINGESYKNGSIFVVREVRHSVIFVTVDPGRYIALSHFEYNVLEPVEPAETDDDVLTVDETEVPKSVIDLLANLARRLTELERKFESLESKQKRLIDRIADTEEKLEMILDDIVTLDERTQPLAAVLSALAKAVKADE